jgi:hypothetical protein
MALAETANLLVKLTLQDDASATAGRVKTSIRDMGVTALSVAGAAGFGALAAGAAQAERAQGGFMAATGASRQEAERFVEGLDSLAGSTGTVGMKFEDLAELGTTVAQQFQTTGQDTIDLTENIAEFARVTGTDANDAASGLEDTLSAYGLSADEAAGFMDELVVSNQKFGTETGPEALSVLQNMAPALQTMGADLEDGVGFLNLFETAGLDAGTAAAGLNKAVGDLKPGQTLDDLIAQIGAIEDPTLRAQEAIEIFGAKAGPKLALAIKPGMTSLDEFKVSAEDAAGATDKAAESLLTTADKLRGLGEKLAAGARDIGQQFGPLVTGLGSLGSLFGPALAKSVGAAWEMAASSQVVQTAVSKASELMSSSLGTGIKAFGVVAVGAALAAVIIQASDDAKTKIANNPNAITPEDLFQMRAPMWAKAKLQIAQQMQDLGTEALAAFNKTWDDGIAQGMSPSDPALLAAAEAAGRALGEGSGSAAVDALASHISSERAEFVSIGTDKIAAPIAAGIAAGSPQVVDAGRGITDQFYAYWRGQQPTVKGLGADTTSSLVSGLRSGLPDVHQAWKDYVDSMHNALDPAKEVAWLTGKLTSQKLQAGLASQNPFVKAAAIETRDALQAQLDALTTLGYSDGEDMGQGVTSGLNSQAGEAAAAAAAIMRRIEAALHDVRVNVHVDQDPGHVPGGGRAAGGPVRKGVAYIVGERRPELFIPDANGTIMPNLPPMSQPHPYSAMGNVPLQVNVQVLQSSREVLTQQAHYQVLAGGRPPVSRV